VKPHGTKIVFISGLLLAAAAVSASRAHAEQFVLIDLTYEATAQNTMDSHFVATPAANIPKNLKTPIDYASGTAYVHFEVLTKPSAAKTLYNICFENPSNYACLPYPPAYTATGKYDFNAKFSAFWQGDLVDWTMGITKLQLVLKDENETKVQGNAMFYPTKIHVTITLVSPGSTFVPPDMAAAGSGGAMAGSGGTGAAAGGGGRGGGGGAAGMRGSAGAGGAGSSAGQAGQSGSSDAGSVSTGRGSAGMPGSTTGPGVEAGSPGTPTQAGSGAEEDEPVGVPTTDESVGQLPPQGVAKPQPNKRAPPPGNIEAGCSTLAPRAARSGTHELAALSCLVALVGAARTRRRRRQRHGA
jgi:hypothetical protein